MATSVQEMALNGEICAIYGHWWKYDGKSWTQRGREHRHCRLCLKRQFQQESSFKWEDRDGLYASDGKK